MLHIILSAFFLFLPLVAASGNLNAQDEMPLKLVPVCSQDLANQRAWKVQNHTAAEIVFMWQVDQTGQYGSDVVAAGGEAAFTTISVEGPNTTRIFVNGQQMDVQDGSPERCNLAPSPHTYAACNCNPNPDT
jgi:hypothetical protein